MKDSIPIIKSEQRLRSVELIPFRKDRVLGITSPDGQVPESVLSLGEQIEALYSEWQAWVDDIPSEGELPPLPPNVRAFSILRDLIPAAKALAETANDLMWLCTTETGCTCKRCSVNRIRELTGSLE